MYLNPITLFRTEYVREKLLDQCFIKFNNIINEAVESFFE